MAADPSQLPDWITVAEAEALLRLPHNRGYALAKTTWAPYVKRLGERGIRLHKASLLALPVSREERNDLVVKLRTQLAERDREIERLRRKLSDANKVLQAAITMTAAEDAESSRRAG